MKKTAKLIYYTSDSWDRCQAVVSPGCISREEFETDTRCDDDCQRDIAAGLVCARHGRGQGHCVHVLAPGRHCHALAGQRRDEELHGRETGRIVMNARGGYDEILEPAHPATPPSTDPASIPGCAHAQLRPRLARQNVKGGPLSWTRRP